MFDIGSMLLSPLIGAVGGIATQYISLQSKKVDVADRKSAREHEGKMAELQHQQALDMLNAESAAASRATVLEGEIAYAQQDLQNLNAAMSTLPRWSGIQPDDSPSLRWFKTTIESLQTLTRVIITLGFGFGIGILMWRIQTLINQAIASMGTTVITSEVISDVVTTTYQGFWTLGGLAIGFWFAARSSSLRVQKINESGQADRV